MQATTKKNSDTEVTLTISAGEEDLRYFKKRTLERLQKEVSAPGFRKGKAPLSVVEQQVDPKLLNAEFVDEAVNGLYVRAAQEQKLRPVDRPVVQVNSFVPFAQLEFEAKVEIVPEITLGDYKKIKKQPSKTEVTSEDVEKVITNLQQQLATKAEVERAAKDGDEAWIDFEGTDADGKSVAGASGKDYPLRIGSGTFIPGFEENVIGLKPGDSKSFEITFPKDYAHKPLAGAKVTFDITVKKVNEVVLPEPDDDFASKVGPFKTIDELKEDIEKQLESQKQEEATNELKDAIIGELAEKSTITPPSTLVREQVEQLTAEFKQNLVYRGITFPEYLKQQGISEEELTDRDIKPRAERRVITGLLLAEVAEAEKINITPEELEVRIELLKGQHADPARQAEFDRPETRQEVASRLLTEKTVNKLVDYATSK